MRGCTPCSRAACVCELTEPVGGGGTPWTGCTDQFPAGTLTPSSQVSVYLTNTTVREKGGSLPRDEAFSLQDDFGSKVCVETGKPVVCLRPPVPRTSAYLSKSDPPCKKVIAN
jgi:hypothetical protein